MSERMKNLLLFAGVFLALDIGAAQVAKRTIDVWDFNGMRRLEQRYRVPSSIYHHELAPKVEVDGWWGNIRYHYLTNSLGFRDESRRDVPREAKHSRLLFLGDSFTEGLGVRYDSTFVGIIADRLRDKGVEVLNGAVASYSPAIYYRKTKHLLDELRLELDAVIVFIDISDIGDEARAYRLDSADRVVSLPEPPKPFSLRVKHLLRDNSLTVHLADALKDVLGNRKSYGIDQANALWTSDEALYREYGREGLIRGRENMQHLLELTLRHNVALGIVVYPWPDQIFLRELESRQVTFWREWAEANGVQFFNLFPAFITDADPRETIRKYFIPYDFHWNADGHRLIAESVLSQGLEKLVRPPAQPEMRAGVQGAERATGGHDAEGD